MHLVFKGIFPSIGTDVFWSTISIENVGNVENTYVCDSTNKKTHLIFMLRWDEFNTHELWYYIQGNDN